jgi:hypothetical protein
MDDLRDLATLCKKIDSLTAEVETLRKERDEARVYASAFMYMNMVFSPKGKGMNQETYADEMGWDCFKKADCIATRRQSNE